MKKVLALLSVCAMISLAACNNAKTSENGAADSTKVENTTVTNESNTTMNNNMAPADTAHKMAADTTHKM